MFERNFFPATSRYWQAGVFGSKLGVNSHTKNLVAACLILKEQRKEIGRAIIFPLF
jgi:hypothetical protein